MNESIKEKKENLFSGQQSFCCHRVSSWKCWHAKAQCLNNWNQFSLLQ